MTLPLAPSLRRNHPRRGPLKLTTLELPPDLHARVKQHAQTKRIAMRTVWAEAITKYLEQTT